MIIRTENIYKSFFVNNKKIKVIQNINFESSPEGITVILGKSGCGKTTFLRLLAQLEIQDSGKIIIEDNAKISIVFQEHRLMPWLNVFSNITFGMNKSEKKECKDKIYNLINMIGLNGFDKAYPYQLSLGMMQRVAIARALANDSDIILMDEPFASLDYFTRETLQNETVNICMNSKKSIIFVTHSIDESLILGKKIIIFEGGKIKKEYGLNHENYDRNILSPFFIELKKDILNSIKN
ncbi:ABC transporter ATP-binding protein [Brachyspira aalborgi]|uniref:ABC transporter ATP-binding protein n=1 Tax=Brachyspira aalborgi TaxID=29522 RepID=A0A5C8G543_9SPIR|nr:ABC transporter ATP-binding protein [Brachyspira aalborgi]TXJ16693.1 ABC transporter ATP-binding protein [Brachyspira aalborgi]TXJ22103.1 ABC transporter ATP-binding protein [Brachyspira aalborgi]TXJ26866.1 ABC transporter ATP-binding protein [Brachyspira aalborgi]TXJ50649.1 ABC transporter ATP-binding protein [Brachyspira aalborgi]TXJ57024.1 ABC transporter ATP-binding protein [Brachyspira aalborgi]